MQRETIIREARQIFALEYGNVAPERGCLYWAEAFNQAARRHGLKALLQAGSAQFQFRADSDGVSNTHFSYMFDPTEAIERLNRGLWPEMHAWSALLDTREIVDLSLAFQEQQASTLCGFVWEKEFRLPPYLWGKPNNNNMIYVPDSKAILLCMMALRQEQHKNNEHNKQVNEHHRHGVSDQHRSDGHRAWQAS